MQITYICLIFCLIGAAATSDSDSQAVSEKAYWDPGISSAGVESGHTGKKTTHLRILTTTTHKQKKTLKTKRFPLTWSSPQDSDNPDLRDRGYIYWRLLSTDPVAAKEVVLAEKPLISEETDLIEPTLLEELICHIGTLASVYHKPPSAFVEGSRGVQHKRLPASGGS